MRYIYGIVLFLSFLLLPYTHASAFSLIHHYILVSIDPERGSLFVEDKIHLPEGHQGDIYFFIHKGLNPEVIDWDDEQKAKPELIKSEKISGHLESFKIVLSPEIRSITLRYKGIIRHPLDPEEKEMARGFRMTKGLISPEGVYLSGQTGWYPLFEDALITFSLKVHLPDGWKSVSQGERNVRDGYEIWLEDKPQEEIFLIANRFIEYLRKHKDIELMVFLRSPDEAIAKRYLNKTEEYITLYERLLGPYPYKKFALVENFWETGLGMPSFTLLGPKIIRFPFIIDTSYPHEILHNWWGNSVYPDYSKGNWAEGLTAYLSDYLFKEEKAEDIEYRMTTLQKFTDYVREEKDFPIRDFRVRHSPEAEAIGYGKTLMFYHMLRQKIGDFAFLEGLRNFFKKHKFSLASFEDLRISFEEASKSSLKEEFDQWINRKGAPELILRDVFVDRLKENKFSLKIKLAQIQEEEPFNIRVPVIITTERGVREETFLMGKKESEFEILLDSQPLRVDIDPFFNIMRRLNKDEIPPAISRLLGAKELLIVLPTKEDRDKYKRLADLLKISASGSVEIKEDRYLEGLRVDKAVIILGWENRFFKDFERSLSKYANSIQLKEVSIRINGSEVRRNGHSFVITSKNPLKEDQEILFISTNRPEELGRKLPHYHKYSYLVFNDEGMINLLKGRWPVLDSPLSKNLKDKGIEIPVVKKRRLLDSLSIDIMKKHVLTLSGDDMEGRRPNSTGFVKAQKYIIRQLEDLGLKPQVDEKGNIYAKLEGLGDKCVVIGAHYDHLGKGYPGADDNASGVAILLELAYMLKKEVSSNSPNRDYLFAFFSEEEEGRIGSKFFVRNYKDINKCIVMINLDTVGRLFDRRLLIIGTYTSEDWIPILKEISDKENIVIDFVKERLDSSDNISFEEVGIPAIQLTSGPHPDYHRPTDTFDKIDIEGLFKILKFTKRLMMNLEKKELPFSKSLAKDRVDQKDTKRRVSLGTIPDFTYKDKGYRIEDVLPNSPAELVNLKKGDVIISIDIYEISSLKDFSEILKKYKPGDKIKIKFLRNQKEMAVEVELVERDH